MEFRGFTMLILSAFGLLASSARASTPHFQEGCSFYRETAASLGCEGEPPSERASAERYLLGFGIRYCERFAAASVAWNPRLQAWVEGTTTCLQRKIDQYLSRGGSCAGLARAAFDSHPECYRKGGFCRLSAREIEQIGAVIDRKDLSRAERRKLSSASS
jgi:hypothetical protein